MLLDGGVSILWIFTCQGGVLEIDELYFFVVS